MNDSDYPNTPQGIIARLREHADRVAGGGPSDRNYDPETLEIEHDAADQIESLASRLAESESERMEQARLNGMGSEREAALMGTVERLKRELAKAHSALEPLAALADAYDAELRSRGCAIPVVHEGDDGCVALPIQRVIPFLRKRPQPYYITMRDACAARKAKNAQ